MANETTIPALPCRSIDETLEFYVALGFEITYKQARPNTYACVKYEDIELHFFTMKGYEPQDSYSTCIVLVPDLAALHGVFASGLRSHYGKLLTAGIPRLSKLNNANADKQLRFNVIDPGGNWIRFIQQGDPPDSPEPAENGAQSKLSRAVRAADWLFEAHGDFAGAAEILDKALAQADAAPPAHRVQALVLRAALAVGLDDFALARSSLEQLHALPLDASDRAALADEFQRADDLAKQIG